MTRRKFQIAFALVLATALLVAWQMAPAEERAVKPSKLPKAVRDTVKKAFPKAQVAKAGIEEESVIVYEVSFTENGQRREIAVTGGGVILEVETVVGEKDLPKAVASALAKAAEGGKVWKVEKIEYLADIKIVKREKPEIAYEVKFRKDGKTMEMKWDAKGNLLKGDEDDEAEEEEGEEEEQEEKLTINQVPAAVKATILKEAGKNELMEIEKETKAGETIYEAEWMEGDKKIEIKVAPDGKVLEREVE